MEQDSFVNIVDILYVCIIAPIIEEIIFRGWIVTILKKYNPYCAILFSAFTFGLIHGNIYQAIPAFFIGIMLGYMVIRFNSLIPTIVTHAIINTTSVVASRLQLSFPEIFYQATLVLTLLFILVLIIIYRKKLKSGLKGVAGTSYLPIYSISFLFSILVYIAMIILTK